VTTGSQEKAKQLDRAGRERALILAAAKLFATRGYEATTTREIAKTAGCAEGLISRYFRGKAGLLVAIIRMHISEEMLELKSILPPAGTVEEEILQLIAWEVDHMWEEREFIKVMMPRLLLDPAAGKEVIQLGPVRRTELMTERLRRHEKGRALPEEEIRALAEAIGSLGLIFGFLNPVARVEDRERAKATALTIGRMLARSL
jgi:AcrR family transcriptional regulator